MKKKISSPVFDLSQRYGLISVSGEKAAPFLQGQLSNDIHTLRPGSYQWSAYCNLKGRIRALLRVWLQEPHYFLLLPKSILAQTLSVLKHYGRFSKIIIEDKSTDYFIRGFLNPDETILNNLRAEGIQLLPLPDAIPRFIVVGPNVGADLRCGPVPQNTDPVSQNACPTLTDLHLDSIYTGNITQWQALDIRAGIPEIFPKTVELFLPHHLGLPALGALSFSKGCFCGQEVIARMEYRSTPKRGLAYVQIDAYEGPLPTPGSLIYEDLKSTHSIGMVVNAIQIESLEMLVEIEKDAAQDQGLIFRSDTDKSRANIRGHRDDTEIGPYSHYSKKTFF